jgi:hypothetical protein
MIAAESPGAAALVAICVCTARRNRELQALLRTLSKQTALRHRPEDFCVVVVDNNPDAAAKPVVDAWASTVLLPVVYDHVAEPGISAARNRVLDLAGSVAPLAALIDDDEHPDDHWLEELLASQSRTGAPITIGRMLQRFPPDTPDWVTDAGVFDLPPVPDGTALREGLTGNALIEVASLARHGLRFDAQLGRSGGEDQLLFRQASRRGLAIHYAARAVVWEVVPPDRLTWRAIAAKYYRRGNSLGLFARQFPELGETRRRRAAAAAKAAGIGLGLVAASPAHGGRVGLARGVCRLWCAAGMVGGLLGRRFDAYHPQPALKPVRLGMG